MPNDFDDTLPGSYDPNHAFRNLFYRIRTLEDWRRDMDSKMTLLLKNQEKAEEVRGQILVALADVRDKVLDIKRDVRGWRAAQKWLALVAIPVVAAIILFVVKRVFGV